MNTSLIAYYKERAAEYEKIYSKPERQPDLQQATHILQQTFTGKNVFEIACGTGFWTERIAKTATSILATDINGSVLEIAKTKVYAPAGVTFELADIFQLHKYPPCESLFGGFIWSHIPVQQLNDFLDIVDHFVAPGGTVVFMDNNYVSGSNLPITRSDRYGNTYQTRQLQNGATYEVLKNFPDQNIIKAQLTGRSTGLNYINLTYFWIAIWKK